MVAFDYRQALEIRDALARHAVRYLFIGSRGATSSHGSRSATGLGHQGW